MIDCEAVLFDMDGVLVEKLLKHWGEGHGIPFSRVAAIHHGRTTVETIRLVAPHLDAEEEARQLDAIEREYTDGLVAFAGAARLLAALPEERWAIVTSAPRETAMLRHATCWSSLATRSYRC